MTVTYIDRRGRRVDPWGNVVEDEQPKEETKGKKTAKDEKKGDS